MFLTKLSAFQFASYYTQATSFPKSSLFLTRLRNGEGNLYFHYDEANQRMVYEAKLGSLLVGIMVGMDKKVLSPYGLEYRDMDAPFRYALAVYIHEVDAKSTPDQMKARYGHYYSSLYKMTMLDEQEAREYARDKADLLALVKEISEAPNTPELKKGQLDLYLELDLSEKGNRILLGVSSGKAIKTFPSPNAFFSALHANRLLSLGPGNQVNLNTDCFNEDDQKAIFFLSSALKDGTYGEYSPMALKNRDVPPLLSYRKGRNISINGDLYYVETEVEPISVSINQDGRIVSNVDLHKKLLPIFSSRINALIDKKEKVVRLAEFANPISKKLFLFFVEHPHFHYEMMEEEISGELLPAIQSSVEIAPEFKKKSEAYRSAISYYVALNDDGTLSMHTEYHIKGEPVTADIYRQEDQKNTYGSFLSAIEAMNMEENGIFDDEELIGAILASDLPSLAQVCDLYLSENIQAKALVRSLDFNITAHSGIDWFDIEVQSNSLSAEEVNKILAAYRKKQKFVRIGKNFYELNNKEMAMVAEKFMGQEEEKDGPNNVKFPLYQALNLAQLSSVHVAMSERLKSLLRELSSFQESEVSLSKEYLDVLRPYQLDAVKWLSVLARNNLSGILADDMGLGKSLELIAFLSTLEEKGPVLIVSPKSLLYNWKNEFAKWGSKKNVFVVDGTKAHRKELLSGAKNSQNCVYVSSYDSLRNDEEFYTSIPFSTLILDEGQYIANAMAQKTKAVKKLKADHRFVLTGTPIQNSYMDLWSIFDFLLPGYLEGFKEFKSMYASLEPEYQAEIKSLEKRVAPFILRRKKKDVLKDLPPKTEEVMTISLSNRSYSLYQAYLEKAKFTIHSGDKGSKLRILADLTRMRQICVDPSSFLQDYEELSEKLQTAISLAKEASLGGHKVLYFSSFTTVLEHLAKELDAEGIPSYYISGQTDADDRLSLAEHFNNEDDVSVMLVSLKAGGTGLNLIGADIVVHLDPWWNLAAENQASDRAHRIGQTRPVTVIKLVAKDTVEEKIINLQKQKKALTAIIHGQGEEGASLSEEDIEFLLS